MNRKNRHQKSCLSARWFHKACFYVVYVLFKEKNIDKIAKLKQLALPGNTRVRIGSKCVEVEILLNFENCSRTFQGGFRKFHCGIMFLHY